MSDIPESKEGVAYKLLLQIAANENKIMQGTIKNTDKNWILDTYEECLNTVNREIRGS